MQKLPSKNTSASRNYIVRRAVSPVTVWCRISRTVNREYVRLIAEIGSEANLPKGFNVSGDGWLTAEAEIEDAVFADNAFLTARLCNDYLNRAMKYFAWARENARRAA